MENRLVAVRDKGCGQTGCACVPASVCLTLGDPTDCSLPGSSVCKDSLGKISGVGCRQRSQGAFPTRGWNEVPPVSCTGMQALYREPHLGSLSRQVRTALKGQPERLCGGVQFCFLNLVVVTQPYVCNKTAQNHTRMHTNEYSTHIVSYE